MLLLVCRIHVFPSDKKQCKARERWIKCIGRADPKNTQSLLQPTRNHVVCSVHFIDGKPTEEHPDPELFLQPLDTSIKTVSRGHPVNRKMLYIERLDTQHGDGASIAADIDNMVTDEVNVTSTLEQPSVSAIVTALKVIIFLLLAVFRKVKEENRVLKMENRALRRACTRSGQIAYSFTHMSKS